MQSQSTSQQGLYVCVCVGKKKDKLILKFLWKYTEPGKTISRVSKQTFITGIKSYSLVVPRRGQTCRMKTGKKRETG